MANPPEYTVTQSIGYAPFFNPPNSPLGFESYVIINYGRLFLEWAGLVVLTGAAILFTGKK
ncbi:MAG: hypothetical protein D4R67_00310 [Bacteroidetes bacterium]|nr:MAG: hypothetical protein D4R67_00310 [Bacteroidota bacterium]